MQPSLTSWKSGSGVISLMSDPAARRVLSSLATEAINSSGENRVTLEHPASWI